MIFGIIGANEADQEMIVRGLSDLRDAANVDDGVFWGIVAINTDSPEAVGFAIDWMIEEGVAYDLVLEPAIEEQVPEAWKKNADQTVKIKDTDKKVVDRLLKEDGTHLLVLAGFEGPSDEVQAHAQRAFDGGIKVHDLADGAREIDFGEDVTDATDDTDADADSDDVDFLALGTAAEDEDDADAQNKLTELGTEAGLDAEAMDGMSWMELAEALADVASNNESDSAEDVPAPKKGSSKGKGANLWTDEALRAKTIKELRVIASQTGVEGAGKLGLEALVTALKGQPVAGGEEPEEEAPAAPKAAATRTKKGAAADVETSDLDAAAMAIGRAVINALKALTS